MRSRSISETVKSVVRRNTEEVQGGGNFELFEELFADGFIDHTPQPNMTPDKAGARGLYLASRMLGCFRDNPLTRQEFLSMID